jgi:hypothetical protein
MKRILLQFLTEKGCKSYWQAEEAGKKESYLNRKIVNSIFKDKVLSENPLIVEIEIKSVRMALAVNLQEQIRKGLEKFGAELGKDFKLEVE